MSVVILALSAAVLGLAVARRNRGAVASAWLRLGKAGVAAWSVRLIALGDRNSFLLLVLAAAAGYFSFRRPPRRILLVAAVVVGVYGYNVIEVTRTQGLSTQVLAAAISGSDSASAETSDSSFTLSTIGVRAAIGGVPTFVPYGLGRYKLIGFSGILPFVRGLALSDYTGPLSSSDILDELLIPNASWNLGADVVSDIYVDFGPLAVPICLLAVGLIAGLLERRVKARQNDPRAIALYLMMVASFAELPRYSLDFPVRSMFWTVSVFAVVAALPRRAAVRPTPRTPFPLRIRT
jgi:oligosaccharide repeat unit polymerase